MMTCRYQDDWLKTSGNTLQLWEKAPLEPYALPKPVRFFTWLAPAKTKTLYLLGWSGFRNCSVYDLNLWLADKLFCYMPRY